MVRRLILFGLLAGLFLMPTMASANALVFTFTGTTHVGLVRFGTTVGGAGVHTITSAVLSGAFNSPSGPSITGSNVGTVDFSTGTLASKVGTLYTFNSGGGITVNGNGNNGMPVGSLFTGAFSSPVSFQLSMLPNHHTGNLTGKVITNSLSPALLAALGLPFQSHGTAVALVIDVIVNFQPTTGGGQITSGSITLVPEPGTLALFGTGLVGLAGLVRRRLSK